MEPAEYVQTLSLVSVPPSALVRSALADLPLRSRVRAPSPTAVGSAPPRSNHSPQHITHSPYLVLLLPCCFLVALVGFPPRWVAAVLGR